MASSVPRDIADLPIARQFTLRRSDFVNEKGLDPNDSISVRHVTKTPSIPSFRTMASESSEKLPSTRSFEVESQTSIIKHHPARKGAFESAPNPPKRSWRSRLRPSEQTIEDAVMGTSDGMTVPFALTASLAGIAPNARYVMLAGLAEMTAGALSMALGGALQARTEKEAYGSTLKKTKEQVRTSHDCVPDAIQDAFSQWNFSPQTIASITHDLSKTSVDSQTNFVMRFHHEMSVPDSGRYFKSASALGLSYFLAGLIGLFPYMLVKRNQTQTALYIAVAVEAVALYVFGYCKTGINIGWRGKENIVKAFWGAASMVIVGAVATGLAVGLIFAVDMKENVSH